MKTVMKAVIKNVAIVSTLVVIISACGKTDSTAPPAKTVDPATNTNAITDKSLGLSKTSVFETPDPVVTKYSGKSPGGNELYPRAYADAPPQIPHDVESFKPITAKNNACVGCHHNPAMRGKEISKGMPTPISASHYTDLRHKPDTVEEQLIGARYVCTQCHVPQADVTALVDNTFRGSD